MPENPLMAETRIPVQRASPTGRLIFGLTVIGLGVLFLLDELGTIDASAVLRWWPLALLAYGLMRLTGTGCRQHMASGGIITLIGSWLLLRAMGVLPFGLHDFWPIVLIALGGIMVAGGFRRGRAGAETGRSRDAASSLSAFAFWSGVDRKVVTQSFEGGDITAFMGGHEIDLRAARMAGESAAIDLFVMMGGVDMRIPEDWTVSYDGVLIMGGVEDRTRPPAGEVRGRLILRGFVMMGGIEVKN
jgi:predicted membrane protein